MWLCAQLSVHRIEQHPAAAAAAAAAAATSSATKITKQHRALAQQYITGVPPHREQHLIRLQVPAMSPLLVVCEHRQTAATLFTDREVINIDNERSVSGSGGSWLTPLLP